MARNTIVVRYRHGKAISRHDDEAVKDQETSVSSKRKRCPRQAVYALAASGSVEAAPSTPLHSYGQDVLRT